MPAVLLVCTANMCRSPMASVLFRALLKARGVDGWKVESAGTWGKDNMPASSNAQVVMAERGLDLSGHRSRIVQDNLLYPFDLVLTMEKGQKEALRIEFPDLAERIFLLSEMSGRQANVHDPVGRSIEEYRKTAERLEMLLSEGWEEMMRLGEKAQA